MENEIHEVNKKIENYILSNDAYHAKQDSLRMDESKMLSDMHKVLLGNPDTGEIGLMKQMAPVLEAWKSMKWIFGFLLGILGLALLVKNLLLK